MHKLAKIRTAAIALAAATTGAAALLIGAPALAAPLTPANVSGPALTIPQAQLDASLVCSPNLAHAKQNPVLLIPGTSTDPESSFGSNYMRAFEASGTPYCGVIVPNHNDGDIQDNAQYVVNAIRTMHARSGRKVNLLGWSQGAGVEPRWALKWWPDARNAVEAFVALDPANQGTQIANFLGCTVAPVVCDPAIWQMMPQSKFIAALNSGPETFPGIAYTVIYSKLSNLIQPNLNGEMSALPPGPNVNNIALQDVCGMFGTGFDHAGVVASAVTYNLVTQAFAHPNRPAQVTPRTTAACGQGTMPYTNSGEYVSNAINIYLDAFTRYLPSTPVRAEPPLRCYASPDKRDCVTN